MAIRGARNPVMVHVRRGDYASDPEVLARHGLLAKDYYESARTAVERRCSGQEYFVFSDDPAAARALLGNWPRVTFVSGLSELEDLALMVQCSNFIIANSSFSWWAAWLGASRDDQIVVAPTRWFRSGRESSTDTSDLIPPSWVRT